MIYILKNEFYKNRRNCIIKLMVGGKMKIRINRLILLISLMVSFFNFFYPVKLVFGEESSFTQSDRERLIRVEATLQEFMKRVDERFGHVDKRFEQVDKRFEQVDKRFEQVDKRFEELRNDMNARFNDMFNYIWIIAVIFGSLVAVTIGFAVWDRKTAIEPAIREIRKTDKKYDELKTALEKYAEGEPKLAEILRTMGLL